MKRVWKKTKTEQTSFGSSLLKAGMQTLENSETARQLSAQRALKMGTAQYRDKKSSRKKGNRYVERGSKSLFDITNPRI